jgi:hypothetical protein
VRVRLRFLLLGLLAFALALLVVFPAAWLKSALPPQLSCASLTGSVWRGQCSSLAVSQPSKPPLRLDSLQWRLHPMSLLRGRVEADITVAGADISAQGTLSLTAGGSVDISALAGTMALDHSRLAALPQGWSALAEASRVSVRIAGNRISALGGTLLARQLRDARGTGFGDFKLEFPEQQAAPFRGTLVDQGGPMQLQSQVELGADQSWQLQGTIVLRPGSPPGLAGALDQLAPADINGLRRFRLEGTAR